MGQQSSTAHEHSLEGKPKPHRTLTTREYEPKILIIGAGASGLACGVRLIEAGFKNVTILEAEERIGGRIFTVRFGDNVIDLGAQWCHGEEGNVVYEEVLDRQLLETTGDIYVTFQCLRSNGEVVPDELVQRLKKILADIFVHKYNELTTFEGSFDAFLNLYFYRMLDEGPNSDIDRKVAIEFFENYKKVEGSEASSELDQVSARGLQQYWVCEGDYLLNWKDKGYREFLRVLLKSQEYHQEMGLLENKVMFGCQAEQIRWGRADGMVEVKCSHNDELFVADHVVVTCSLGVLKEHCRTLFQPELPVWKRSAIDTLGYGNVCKIFLEFEEPFWPQHWTGFATLWCEEDYNELKNSEDAWLLDIFGFYCINYQPRMLVGWIVGTSVSAVESLRDDKVLAGTMYLLRKFITTWTIPEPKRLVRTNWHTNSHFRGAYSFRSMKTEMHGTSAFMLGQPLTTLVNDVFTMAIDDEGADLSNDSIRPRTVKPIVQFGGEATSNHFYSTVHGAVEAGYREASRLIGYYLMEM